jgi:4-amino-4-deoxy-L-arabinose transferase-like glycosyltransferase
MHYSGSYEMMLRRYAIALLFLFVILVRLPFFFQDVIDWDESTFILMGQDILDGNLPYDKLWDIKPPLLFLVFSAFITLFGKTVPGIRLGATLFVALASTLVYIAGIRIWGRRQGFAAALLLALFATVSEAGSAAVSEIIAIVPLTGALLLLLRSDIRRRDLFFTGMLLGVAGLIRLNLAYIAALAIPCLFWGRLLPTRFGAFDRLSWFAVGGTLPVLASFFPYLLAGKCQLYITAMFRAPLIYAGSQYGMFQAAGVYIMRFLDLRYLAGNVLVAAGFLGGIVCIVRSWKQYPHLQRRYIGTVLFFAAVTWISILRSGPAFEDYIIQFLPFALLVAASFLDCLATTGRKQIAVALIVLGLVMPLTRIGREYLDLARRAVLHEKLVFGPSYEIAEYLRKANPEGRPVYMMHLHLVHWLTHTKPVDRVVTHPSTLGKDYLLGCVAGPSATVESELARILAGKPAFIVKKEDVWYLKQHKKALSLLEDTLQTSYVPVLKVEAFTIYRRIQ